MTARYIRPSARYLLKSLEQETGLVHVIVGPRQVGKTTGVHQIGKSLKGPMIYAAADRILPPSREWIETQWWMARKKAAKTKRRTFLILDEVQKVPAWAESVKALWDEDRREALKISPVLLGSSSLLLQRGLSDSLAGRFKLVRFTHWSWAECRAAFGWDLDRWLFFGGYPGAARLIRRQKEWQAFISDALIETAITRDVLQMQTIAKPTLLRHLFAFSALYPAQIFSYNKMLGQLQDAGNTTTLAHYLHLLETAFLVSGLELYSKGQKRKRGSSPKLILWNNALLNAFSGRRYLEARKDPVEWGRIVENAVGAHLLNHLQGVRYHVTYWRERDREVDFVIQVGNQVLALEVKSGRPRLSGGLEAFGCRYPSAKRLVIGRGGMPLKEFFAYDPLTLFQ